MDKKNSVNIPLSHYRIVSRIGAGGMGEVHLAEDTKLERQVALKILRDEVAGDEDRIRRFVQEAKAASALNHPNILTVYEIGEFENSRYIATELIKGETLRERLHGEPLALRETLDIAMQVAAALNAAHEAGIVHRDIKPENIMLRDDGFVKVLDFGLAKLTEKQPANTSSEDATRAQVNTRPGMVMGTVAYMSPEQARGKEIDARSDIWSLGVVIYEMLAKQTPFAGETPNDSIAAILTKEPPPFNESTSAELQRIIRKSLQKKADERYQTVKDLLLDVRNLKRELEFSEELERSQMPTSARSANVSTGQVNENATLMSSVAYSGGILTNTREDLPKGKTQNLSSAEYIVGEIRSHKFGALAILAFLLAALLGGGYWFLGNRIAGSVQINSIAVLPFQNKSGDADTDYLSDGLAESLIYRLSQLPNLKVSPVSSVSRYKGKEFDAQKIASELGVQAVMSGRLAQRGDNLTISVELIDAANNKILWGEQYDRKLSDLLATQREIAATITQKLQLKLAGDEKGITKKYTNNSEAYQLYLKGRFYFARRTKEDLNKSIELFQQAIKLDPGFALAHVGIAESYAVIPSYPYASPADTMPQAKAAVAKALEIDPNLPEAHTVAGMIAATYDWDWAKAESEFKRSLELDPNLAITHYRYAWTFLSPLGRHDEAVAEMKIAMEKEPLYLIQGANFAGVLMYARRFDEALEQAKKTYDLDPNFVGARSWLAHTYNTKGMYAEALSIAEKTLDSDMPFLSDAGFAYARTSRRQEALAVIERWKEGEKKKYVMNYWVAVTYAALGDKDGAFAELEKAYQNRDWFLQRIKVDPFMDPLRGDPRFDEMVKRLNFPN